MTSNWISKSRNGISIPKLPQNNYLNLSYVFLWEKLNPWHFFPGFDLCNMSLGDLNGSRTSSQISKSRKRIRIPIKLQNDYISMSKMFSEGIIGKLVQKLFQKQQNCKNQIFRLKKNCKFEWKMTLDSVIRHPPWVQISCNTSRNFLEVYFVALWIVKRKLWKISNDMILYYVKYRIFS